MIYMDARQADAYRRAQAYDGLAEVPGPEHNDEIVAMFAEVGHEWVKDDETAWCAAFVGAMLSRAGLPLPPLDRRLAARSYLDWGEPVDLEDAVQGDLVVLPRGNSSWQGHVAFLWGRSEQFLFLLGGNQRNAVNISHYEADRVLGVRRWPRPPTWWEAVFGALAGIFGKGRKA